MAELLEDNTFVILLILLVLIGCFSVCILLYFGYYEDESKEEGSGDDDSKNDLTRSPSYNSRIGHMQTASKSIDNFQLNMETNTIPLSGKAKDATKDSVYTKDSAYTVDAVEHEEMLELQSKNSNSCGLE